MGLFEQLELRGLVKQTTNTEKIRSLLNDGEVTFYIGFDPTAESLHVGHLLQLVTAQRLIEAGHNCIILIGGATAMIGDPTGKSEMRKMLSFSDVRVNSSDIETQIHKILNWPGAFTSINNMMWFSGLGFLEMLRMVGPHFSVNNMLRAECFKSRMEHGLSFMEFNYMIMQATDFLKLNEWENCTLQLGGDDQWSNILAGIDLVHKIRGKEVFGLTIPLLTNSTGQKMGKTEKGAVWLDPNKTTVFDFFQFWRNLPDADVLKCFKMLTFLSMDEINSLEMDCVGNINAAKKRLALEITKIVHGKELAEEALKQAEALFEQQDTSTIEAVEIDDGIQLLDLLVQNGFAKSRTDGRHLISGNGISINDQVVSNPLLVVTRSEFGTDLTIRKGKKKFSRFTFRINNET